VLVGPEKVPTNWRLCWGNEDQATMADLSKPSIDLSEEYLRELDLAKPSKVSSRSRSGSHHPPSTH
jgi:hypothetical protein